MMIKTINGSLLNNKEGILVHGVNCQGKMGSGIGKLIREKYPEAYNDYMCFFEKNKVVRVKMLGDITVTEINEKLFIVNAFTQLYYGRYKNVQYVDYNAISSCFKKINLLAIEKNLPVKFPLIGAGLANGRWELIKERILASLSETVEAELFIYED
jgi:O-acetyl-ADP-ribose deacetylase (regulator of RNase III)